MVADIETKQVSEVEWMVEFHIDPSLDHALVVVISHAHAPHGIKNDMDLHASTGALTKGTDKLASHLAFNE